MLSPPMIVIKSPEFESGISRIKNGTLDEVDIAKLWKAFTSVRQYTVNPLVHAYRLENFWWRVWGSKQKHLSGLKLGRLCSNLCTEAFYLRLHRQSNFNEEYFPQSSILSPTSGSDLENARHHLTTGLHTITSLEKPSAEYFNSHINPKKAINLSAQSTRSDTQFFPDDKTDEKKSATCLVPCITLQPASIRSCDIKPESKRRFGHTIPKKRNKILNKKKQPLVARRFGPHLSTDSAEILNGRAQTRTVKSSSKLYEISAINEKQTLKFLENNFEVPISKSRRAQNMFELKLCDHTHDKIELKRLDAVLCIDENEERVLDSKITKAELDLKLRGLPNKVSRLGSDCLAVQEKLNFDLLTTNLDESRSISQNQILTPLQNLYADPKYQSVISDNRYSNKSLTLSREKIYNLDSNRKTQVDEDLIVSEAIRNDKINNTSLTSQIVTRDITESELSNKLESRIIGPEIPLNIFAKRPIQSKVFLSKSTDNLLKNKSQLTLLIEKDRARIGKGSLPPGQ